MILLRPPRLPSLAILTDLLRGELGFRGAIVTDAMSMYAIAQNFDAGEAALVMLDAAPDAAQAEEAVARTRRAAGAALLHFNRVTSYHPEALLAGDALVTLGRQIVDAGVPLVVTSLGSPYVLARFGAAQALLCSYSECDASLQATLRVLPGAGARAPPRRAGQVRKPAGVCNTPLRSHGKPQAGCGRRGCVPDQALRLGSAAE